MPLTFDALLQHCQVICNFSFQLVDFKSSGKEKNQNNITPQILQVKVGSVNIFPLLAMVRLTGGLVRGPNRGVAFKELMGVGGGRGGGKGHTGIISKVYFPSPEHRAGTITPHTQPVSRCSLGRTWGLCSPLARTSTPPAPLPRSPHTPCPAGHRPPQAAGVPFSGLQPNQFNNSWALRKYPMASPHFKYPGGSKMP